MWSHKSEQEDEVEKEKARFSDSEGLFESIYRKVLTDAGKQRAESPKSEKDSYLKRTPPKAEIPSPPGRKPSTVAKKPSKQISKPAPEPKDVKREAAAAERSHPTLAKAKPESRLKAIAFETLFVVSCRALLSYFGIVDLSRISSLLGLRERTVAQAPQKKATRAVPL